MFIPLKNPLHGGTIVHFEFPVKGKCPEGGAYAGTCCVTYYPDNTLINVANFAKELGQSTRYAELHADRIFKNLGVILGPQSHLKVVLAITEAVDHGPLQITIEGYANG